ncbi:MAG: hypothetical protein R6U50_10100 [Desulfobacterales bacterium]
MPHNLLRDLHTADPELAGRITAELGPDDIPGLVPYIQEMVDAVIWALSLETAFGRTLGLGCVELAKARNARRVPRYVRLIREFGAVGPTLGTIMAETLVPVLKLDDAGIEKRFLHTAAVMLKKGTYTLYNPFKALADLCSENDKAGISAYLHVLSCTFSLDMTYKQCRPFTYMLPKAVMAFSPGKRPFQVEQLCRVIRADFGLAEAFLEGMEKGLRLLSRDALDDFVTIALAKHDRNRNLCAKYLSLTSSTALNSFESMQVTVSLSRVRYFIMQYIGARTGRHLPVKGMKKACGKGVREAFSFSDGSAIWLPEEIGLFAEKQRNLDLYKHLAKLEAGFFEFGTFDFDLEKLMKRLPCRPDIAAHSAASELAQFLHHFPNPDLAKHLFTVFEHGRIKDLTAIRYPGIIRRVLPELQAEAARMLDGSQPFGLLQVLYHHIALGMDHIGGAEIGGAADDKVREIKHLYRWKTARDPVVETAAEMVFLTYPILERRIVRCKNAGMLRTPFNREIDPDLYFSSLSGPDRIAGSIKDKLADKGIHVYRSDLRKRLVENNGEITPADIREIAISPADSNTDTGPALLRNSDLSNVTVTGLLAEAGMCVCPEPEAFENARFYKEWDNRLGDYLHHHTRVRDRMIPGIDGNFYQNTLDRHHGLIKRIRYAFELLKPEGLSILRQWVEGDEFDYRALLDFAVDKKAGVMPSDKLYIKRTKQQRDVAVLLLVDLSRSTANTVVDSVETVLDVEKQAIILFCEALEVVGDRYAVAGFSGTGRLGVDYFHIKDFDEDLDENIRKRINAMAPQRSTRMGAAVRHATVQLDAVSAGVKLLIIIGDGFPNDVDYKKDYALEDTRKAVSEARSKNIYTHGLTVNLPGDPNLDQLYGNVHHHVISDVRELPDKLPRIYSTLTRS